MKLITLNIWGGKLSHPLLTFVSQHTDTDVFCFQEVYSSLMKKKIDRDMQANIYEEIADILKDHQGYFAPHLKDHALDGNVNFTLYAGLAIFIKKSLQVKKHGNIFVYRKGTTLLKNDYKTIPRNLQYALITNGEKDYFVGHFHGIWYPKTKIDTQSRIRQCNTIKRFLSKQRCSKLLCGDFNLLPDTKSMHILEDGMRNLIKEFNILTTRNSFYERGEKLADYILTTPDVHVKKFEAMKVTVSDHLPLLLEFI